MDFSDGGNISCAAFIYIDAAHKHARIIKKSKAEAQVLVREDC